MNDAAPSPRAPVDVTVVIPVKDDYHRLARCLTALSAGSVAPREILVVDNGSDAPDIAAVERAGARWISSPAGGSYAARNIAAAQARGAVLAFTDSDCVPDDRWLAGGLAALRDLPSDAVVGGEIVMFAEDERRRRTTAELHDLVFGLPQAHYVQSHRYAVTANLFVATAAFRRSGGFDDALFSGGDREWGQRMASRGSIVQLGTDAVVRHPARSSVRALLRKARRTERGAAQLDRASGHGGALRILRRLIPPTRSLAQRARPAPPPRRRNAARAVALELFLHTYKNVMYARAYVGR